MSQRERRAPGSTSAAAPHTAVAEALRLQLPIADHNANRALLWDELFRSVTPSQRVELLALAGRQGLLYAEQLPDLGNGKRPTPWPEEPGQFPLLAQLLKGPTEQLPAACPPQLGPDDAGLDPLQREAVARALGTPDICLIAGWPGTGKSRVLAEILTQAARTGRRVLFAAERAAAIDHVLEQVSQRDDIFAVRCLETGERSETLPASLRHYTLAERQRRVREALPAALRGQETAEQRCQQRRHQEALWPDLQDLANALAGVAQRRQEIEQRRARIPVEIAQEVDASRTEATPQPESAFAADLRTEERRHQETLAEIAAAQSKIEQSRDDHAGMLAGLQQEAGSLRPLAEARRHKRWWSPLWWRATLRGNVVARLTEVDDGIGRAEEAVAAANDEARVLHGKRQALDEEHRSTRERLMELESRRRQAVLVELDTALAHEATLLEDKWQGRVETLDPHLRPQRSTPTAVAEAQRRWQEALRHDEEACRFAGQWASFLQASADTISGRLPSMVNVVAGTLPALAADKQFAGELFDVLVVEEAHLLQEADFLKLARRAQRWVLIGEPPWEAPVLPSRAGPAVAGPRSSAAFQRLWRHTACDPRQTAYSWAREGDRLCCRLRAVEPAQRAHLESERVADFQDIELRILTLPRQSPILAEVVFPAAMSMAQAKEYIYKELQELPIQTTAWSGSWLDRGDRLVFHLAEAVDAPATAVALDEGVREYLAESHDSWCTCRLEFDKNAGWTREIAADWLQNHLHLRDNGRTIFLQACYRMRPELQAILAELLFEESLTVCAVGRLQIGPHTPATSNGLTSPIVFVPVPPLPAKGTRLPKEGAALESDLAGPRGSERLPPDLRSELPGRGLINYTEALALVRRLESLVGDPETISGERIAVTAFHPGQVELLRRLIRRSAALCRSSVAIEVGLPGAFCQREFPLVLVSLTRSHGQRAVAFADEISHFVLALTRARRQVILFGDLGTLVRRGQWQGRLDNLDEHTAAHEARLIKHLLRYLQGQGRFAQAFHLCTDECGR